LKFTIFAKFIILGSDQNFRIWNSIMKIFSLGSFFYHIKKPAINYGDIFTPIFFIPKCFHCFTPNFCFLHYFFTAKFLHFLHQIWQNYVFFCKSRIYELSCSARIDSTNQIYCIEKTKVPKILDQNPRFCRFWIQKMEPSFQDFL